MLAVGLVVLLGVLGTGLASFAFRVTAHSWGERALAQKQDLIAKVVMAEVVQYGITLWNLSAALGAQSQLTSDEFDATTAMFSDQWLPGATEVSYVVPATADTAPRLQARWRALGNKSLTLPPAGGFFRVLSKSLNKGPVNVGGDLGKTAEAVTALARARSMRTVAASQTYLLPGRNQRAFIMAAPVFATSPASRLGQFRGWVTIDFLGAGFLGRPVGLLGGDQVSVALADVVDDTPVPIAEWNPPAKPDLSLPARTVSIAAPQRTWTLTVRPTENLLSTTEAFLSETALLIGGLLTLLLAALTASIVTSRDRALHRVDQATATLRTDIERREAVEQQLRRREEELVGFAGVVAHDLRTPLATVTGHAELLGIMAADCLTDKQREHLDRVQGSAARMKDLLDDLLAYATADNVALRIVEIDLNALVDSVLAERLGDGKTVVAKVDCATLPAVAGDPTLVRQILDNLIGNAIKYTPAGQPAELTITAPETAGDLRRIEVADRGIGIPEKQRTEIFNAFTRAEGSEKYQGTGLGLAIVQRIVERHGGAVGVDPNPGGGSRFWFTLPTAASLQSDQSSAVASVNAPTAAPVRPTAPPKAPGNSRRSR